VKTSNHTNCPVTKVRRIEFNGIGTLLYLCVSLSVLAYSLRERVIELRGSVVITSLCFWKNPGSNVGSQTDFPELFLFPLVLPGSCWDNTAYFHFHLINLIIIRALYTGVSFMVSLSPEASWDGPAVGGFLCDEAALLWDIMKGLCTILETGKCPVSLKAASTLFTYCIRS
jgi:hypothetical protein